MAKTRKATAPATVEKRPVGRPRAMPDEDRLMNHMVRVAQDVPDLIGELAAARGQSRGQVVTIIVREAAARRAASLKAAASRKATAASN